MAFSGSAYKDVQGHVDNVFDESFLSKDFLKCKVDQAIISFQVQEGDEETRVIFLSQEKLEEIKQKQQNRHPADVYQRRCNDGEELVNKPLSAAGISEDNARG